MTYSNLYQDYYNPTGRERAGLNAHGPVLCALSIFAIVTLILVFILILPSYFMYWLHEKTKIKSENLPASNEIAQEEFDGW
jgi:hypothetical protein